MVLRRLHNGRPSYAAAAAALRPSAYAKYYATHFHRRDREALVQFAGLHEELSACSYRDAPHRIRRMFQVLK